MRKHYDEYEIGTVDADKRYDSDIIDLSTFTNISNVGSRPNGYRAGTLDRPERMEEGEESNSITTQEDAEQRNVAMEEFANKIKKAVSAKLMGRKLNLRLKGHPDIVKQIANMIKYETEYLDAIISGQAPDTPALQKNKAIIDSESKKLDRMLQTSDFWPFKWGYNMKIDSKLLLEMIDEELQSTQEARKEPHDHEGRMAKGELRDMIKNGLKLYKLIDKDDELPGWVSSYITLASDYMHSVAEYMTEDQQDSEEQIDTDLDDWYSPRKSEVCIMRKTNKKIDSIKIGDLLHYCPADLKQENHDIGIIYDILDLDIKRYKIFWSCSQIYDIYSEVTLLAKLKKIISGKNMMYLIKQNEWIK